MIKILGRPNSVNVQKVMWCTAELGLAVDRTDIGGAFGGNNTPEYLSMNPNGLIPTMIDGETILWESHTIVRYLCETQQQSPWYPDTPAKRGEASQWMDWYLTRLHPSMTTIFWTLIRTPTEDRNLETLEQAIASAGDLWALIDNHLSDRDYMTGDQRTMADIPLGCAAWRWHEMDIKRPNLPNLKAWYERLAARPAYQQHVMLPLT